MWVKRGTRRRMVDTSWPEAEVFQNTALGRRILWGRLHRGHACRCGVTGPRTCGFCLKPLCLNCAVRPKKPKPRPRVHPRCLVNRDGWAGVKHLVGHWTRTAGA